MWDADDDKLDLHANDSHSSKSPGFTLDDAFLEDDSTLDAAFEFNPAAIRAALARTLATGESESSQDQNHAEDNNGQSTEAGVSSRNPNHDRNGSVGVEDPDASVSTLDINASPAHARGRAPGEWSRSTSYSHGYGYRQDSRDTTSGMESLENFSSISLSDSVHDLEPVEISLEPSEDKVIQEEGEEDTEVYDEGLLRAVHIDLSQDGKPRVEEVVTVLPEPSNQHRDGARTPSPKPPLPPPLPSTSNHTYSAHTSSSASTPTSKLFLNHQSQSQSVPELPSPTTYRRSTEDTYTHDETSHTPPDSAGTVLSVGSPVSASSTATPGSIPTPNSTASPRNSSQSESSRRGHRLSRSVGPSALDKVISRTRPSFLPPKPKTEDLKHLADWEAMMKQSRAVGEFHLGSLILFLCCFCALGGFKRIDPQLFLSNYECFHNPSPGHRSCGPSPQKNRNEKLLKNDDSRGRNEQRK